MAQVKKTKLAAYLATLVVIACIARYIKPEGDYLPGSCVVHSKCQVQVTVCSMEINGHEALPSSRWQRRLSI